MGQQEIFNLLEKHPKGLLTTEIAKKLKVRRENISRSLRSMINAGEVLTENVKVKHWWGLKYRLRKVCNYLTEVKIKPKDL